MVWVSLLRMGGPQKRKARGTHAAFVCGECRYQNFCMKDTNQASKVRGGSRPYSHGDVVWYMIGGLLVSDVACPTGLWSSWPDVVTQRHVEVDIWNFQSGFGCPKMPRSAWPES